LIYEKIFASYPSAGTSFSTLPELCAALLDEQKSSWPLLHEGWNALKSSTTREIVCKGFSVRVQYNPKRIISTGAKLDEQSIRGRECFLCSKNLPEEQKGILYEEKFLILGNPIPIFQQHFTVAYIEHMTQAFNPFVDDFLTLTAALSPALTLFYNGPRCGASAPDHMHFQACSSGVIPIERDIMDISKRLPLRTVNGVTFSTIEDYGRGVILIESNDLKNCAHMIRQLENIMQEPGNDPEEPMMNILGLYQDRKWSIVVFPRRKHRPSVYFKNERVVISPAAVDMGGFIITPIEKDYRGIEANLIESIYLEVGVSTDIIKKYIEKI